MTKLRRQLVRLAHTHEGLRPHLLPILKGADWSPSPAEFGAKDALDDFTVALAAIVKDLHDGDVGDVLISAHRLRESAAELEASLKDIVDHPDVSIFYDVLAQAIIHKMHSLH